MENVHLLFVTCALKPSSTSFPCIGLITVYNRNERTISLPRKKYDTQISTETKTGKSVNGKTAASVTALSIKWYHSVAKRWFENIYSSIAVVNFYDIFFFVSINSLLFSRNNRRNSNTWQKENFLFIFFANKYPKIEEKILEIRVLIWRGF